MVIPGSSARAARQFLFDQCTASLTPDPLSKTSQLLVCYDEPGTDQPDDIVVIGDVARDINVNSLVGSAGKGFLDEVYTITVEIEIYRGGDDADAVFARSALLVDAVISVVRSDPSLGGAVLWAIPTNSTYSGTWTDDHTGRVGSGTVTIQCKQRI